MKALACLRELRSGSVMYEEPDAYNSLLHELKSKYECSAKSHLWQAVRDDVVGKKRNGLITSEETEESKECASHLSFAMIYPMSSNDLNASPRWQPVE